MKILGLLLFCVLFLVSTFNAHGGPGTIAGPGKLEDAPNIQWVESEGLKKVLLKSWLAPSPDTELQALLVDPESRYSVFLLRYSAQYVSPELAGVSKVVVRVQHPDFDLVREQTAWVQDVYNNLVRAEVPVGPWQAYESAPGQIDGIKNMPKWQADFEMVVDGDFIASADVFQSISDFLTLQRDSSLVEAMKSRGADAEPSAGAHCDKSLK